MWQEKVPDGVERWQGKGKCPEETMELKWQLRRPDGGQHSISGWHTYHEARGKTRNNSKQDRKNRRTDFSCLSGGFWYQEKTSDWKACQLRGETQNERWYQVNLIFNAGFATYYLGDLTNHLRMMGGRGCPTKCILNTCPGGWEVGKGQVTWNHGKHQGPGRLEWVVED